MKKHINIPVFVPELSCPHQCVFCNQEKITGKTFIPDPTTIHSTVSNYLSTANPDTTDVEIAFFGGNFTGIPHELQKQYLDETRSYIEKGIVNSIRISTRPDFINEASLKFLKQYNVKVIELGAQSFDGNVLKKSGRGHTSEDTIKAAKLIKDYGFSLGLQMMAGLPGDTPESVKLTAERITDLGADNTRIYPVIVIKGTVLETLYRNNQYTPLSIPEAVEYVKPAYLHFETHNVTVLRVGLHPSEGLLNGDEFVAGPYHVSFREILLTDIWKDLLDSLIEPERGNSLTIFLAENQKNYAAGFKASNRKWLEEKFKNVTFVADKHLTGRNFRVEYTDR